jgi:hypothetical protein
MNAKGRMTHASWITAVTFIARGLRALPVVRDHPLWWFRLHLDGLKSHEAVYKANEIFFLFRILLVIERSNSSHVNQAYDKDPARVSKDTMRTFIPAVRDTLGYIVGHEMDQWALLKVVAGCERYITEEAWVRCVVGCCFPHHRSTLFAEASSV